MEEYYLENCSQSRREEWLEMVTEVFSETPLKYFENHLDNDPNAKIEDAIVAIHRETEKIASSVRLIKRKINLYHDNKTFNLSFGGIAEVSTRINHRKKGLASKILKRMIEIMKENKIIVSGLMTGSQAPFYEKLGWISIAMEYSSIEIEKKSSFSEKYKYREIDWVKDLKEIQKIYTNFCSHYKLQGSFTRKSDDYWLRWVKVEIGKAIVAEKDGKVVALVSTNFKRGNRLLYDSYCDCGVIDEKERGDLFYEMLQFLIFDQLDEKEEKITLGVYKFMSLLMNKPSIHDRIEYGAMYFPINLPLLQEETGITDSQSFIEAFKNGSHVNWLTDRY
eukprot:TRINITY_DN9482_c0_g1_i1.p1 TRINITY_DN9482_c0_g1~~TRINITY_DN9482_c0_g1_i1.p1  ORF type:complete len:335 (+),score=87.61 TRINITY_DN9482_c0_g1_i1:48-1052(+)